MGCVAATAKRRRRQATINYRHMSPQRRPRYSTPTSEASARREAKTAENRLRMQQGKRKGK